MSPITSSTHLFARLAAQSSPSSLSRSLLVTRDNSSLSATDTSLVIKIVIGIVVCILTGLAFLGYRRRSRQQAVKRLRSDVQQNLLREVRDWEQGGLQVAGGGGAGGRGTVPYLTVTADARGSRPSRSEEGIVDVERGLLRKQHPVVVEHAEHDIALNGGERWNGGGGVEEESWRHERKGGDGAMTARH